MENEQKELNGKSVNDKYAAFLLKEYSEVVQAHFKSISTISTFFRHYLLIMSIPITAIAFFFKSIPTQVQLKLIIQNYNTILSIAFLAISLIGIGVLCYIINLRLDAVLYARTVNAIRKYFYDLSTYDINQKIQTRILPQSSHVPFYLEKGSFFPLVFAFGIINSLYFSLFYYIHNYNLNVLEKVFPAATLVFLGVFTLHFIIYLSYSEIREKEYLKSNSIGIDIDGVLNKQCEHFCNYLKKLTNIDLKPEKITVGPIHEHPILGESITEKKSNKVFNNPDYWVQMPKIENVEYYIKKIKNSLNFRIFIFTHRPWPSLVDKNELINRKKSFLKKCERISLHDNFFRIFNISKIEPLNQITKEWLNKNNILYDKLVVERGNVYVPYPKSRSKNRFQYSRHKKIKFFVEDDIEKAIKLSYICEIVFLIAQPHNKPSSELSNEINELRENFPSNILRVKSWREIYQLIRKLA